MDMAAESLKGTGASTARSIAPDELKALIQSGAELTILDLRRRNAFDADTVTVPGATWYDPERMADWSESLPRDAEIVLYCVHGETISNAAVDHLHAMGRRARLIIGGFDAWKACGGMLAYKP